MGFFDYWFKRPAPPAAAETQDDLGEPVFVPMAQLLRAVIYDAGFAEPEKVIAALGVQGLSSEVEEMEVAASESRLDAIEPLAPFLGIAAALLAKATVAYSTSELEEDLPQEVKEALGEQFQRLALGSSVSTIASLVDIGLIKINGAAIGMGPQADMLPPDFLDKWGGKS